MSLLSRERLVVGLAPERISVLRQAVGWRPRLLDQYSAALAGGANPPWTSGLEALELLLDDPAWGGRELTVVLSSHYVHYAVLPKGKDLAMVEQQDLARLIFRNIYGQLANDWEFRVSPAPDQPTLASGIAQDLLLALRGACEGRATLRSIQPGLMSVFNQSRPTIDRHSGILAVVESGRITLATIEAGQWLAVVSRAGEGGDLPQLLAETGTLAGREAGGRLWLCDLTGKAVPPTLPAWRLERLLGAATGEPSLAAWGMA